LALNILLFNGMINRTIMDIILYIISGPLLLIALAAHLYVKIRLRPKGETDSENYYYEFEDQHPAYAKYTKWSRITFAAIAIATLLLFLAMVI
jgi:hypothetical protein